MKITLKTGVAGLSLISMLALVPSCTRDTGQADDANNSDDAANTEVGAGADSDAGLNGDVDNRPLSLTARLVDADEMGAMHAAVVEVEVTGVRLVDPTSGHDMGGAYGTTGMTGTPSTTEGASGTAGTMTDDGTAGTTTDSDATTGAGTDGTISTQGGLREGHVHYRLDAGPVIATPATRLSFHELAPGEHTVTVMLANSNHMPLGPQQTLTFVIPS